MLRWLNDNDGECWLTYNRQCSRTESDQSPDGFDPAQSSFATP